MKITLNILLFFLFSSLAFAQKLNEDYHLKHTIKQEDQQYEFTVLDFDDKGVYDYDQSKFYFWLKAQKVHATQGYSSGLLLNGEFQAFYVNKQLSQRGYFFKGLKNGEWLYWNDEGVLIQIEHWRSGEKCGTEKTFNDKGEVQSRVKYKLRTIERRTKDSLVIENKARTHQTITTFDERNRKVKTVRTKYGELHGKQQTYKDGKLEKVEYYDDGKAVEKVTFIQRIKAKAKKEKKEDKPSKSEKTNSKKDTKTKKDKDPKKKKNPFSKEKKPSK